MALSMNYRNKITVDRLRPSSVSDTRDLVEETESNRGRIIQSSAIRRLQQKTQVYPLETNAAVRSRLTHSLEVQQTGRFIARRILAEFRERKQLHALGLADIETAFINLVEMSCLMHDVGNPPFGHFGETAINDWMTRHGRDCYQKASSKTETSTLFEKTLWPDICRFEGNAQGVRIITTLQELNLTCSQIAALIKYPRPAYRNKDENGSGHDYFNRKPGYYYAEESLIQRIWECLGMADGHRYPLAYIMEAADDISYCIADLEDAVDKGILTLDTLGHFLKKEWKARCHGQSRYLIEVIDYAMKKTDVIADGRAADVTDHARTADITAYKFFILFRTRLVNDLAKYAAHRYVECHEQIYAGNLNEPLIDGNSEQHLALETLRQVACKHVFSHKEVETPELRGYSALKGLLDIYRPLLEISCEDMAAMVREEHNSSCFISRRLFRRLPKRHVAAYKRCITERADSSITAPRERRELEWYYRIRLLIDYLSGMTDDFVLREFQCLSAI